jgi:hypothetical protein
MARVWSSKDKRWYDELLPTHEKEIHEEEVYAPKEKSKGDAATGNNTTGIDWSIT